MIIKVADPQENTLSKNSKAKGEVKHSITKKHKEPSKALTLLIKNWKDSESAKKVNGYELIKDGTSFDKAIFGLWAIRKTSPDEGKLVTRGYLAKFLLEALEVPVDERTLENALKKDTRKMVHNPEGVKFQILPDGVNYVEKTLFTKATPSTKAK